MDYRDTVPYYRFQGEPNTGVSLPQGTLARDLYAYEAIKYPDKSLPNMDPRHPFAKMPPLILNLPFKQNN